jgi:nucleoside-diphosphate-sugar epimerase
VVSLRFPFLGSGERRHLARVHEQPGHGRRILWAWLDTRDAARAIEAPLTRLPAGHHLINIVAPDMTALEPTAELLWRYHPSSALTQPLDGFATPFSTQRSRELLGFTAAYSWRSL